MLNRFFILAAAVVTVHAAACSSEKSAGSTPDTTLEECGNGSRLPIETCDSNDLGGQTCLSLGYDGGALACAGDCTLETAGCTGIPPICGDGAIEGRELCDGANLAGATCANAGFDGGTLLCDGNCGYDVGGCTGTAPVCGDGNAEGLEECDGLDLRMESCTSLGFDSGALDCTTGCLLDATGCVGGSAAVCGDGQAEGTEKCDTDDTNGIQCTDLGYDDGALGCNANCTFDPANCSGTAAICGDGTKDGLEECDDGDLDGADCASQGFSGGTLTCDSSCTFDTTACTAPVCDNGVLEAGEECDQTDLGGASCGSLSLGTGVLACTSGCVFDTGDCGAATCGDGVVDAVAEECDGDDLAGESCDTLGYSNGRLLCGGDCTLNTGLCFGWTGCGDGTLNGPEECEGTDVGAHTCESLGYENGGVLTCDSCALDVGACDGTGPVCGNDLIEFGEECDNAELAAETCISLGFAAGDLNCSPLCTFAFWNCQMLADPVCGNDRREGMERCDGPDMPAIDCATLNYGTGNLACNDTCDGFDTSGCSNAPVCGNDIRDRGEFCDGTALRNQTCESLNYGTGTLDCEGDCSAFDTSGCSDVPQCGDDQVDLLLLEICDGTDLNGQTCETLGLGTGALDCESDCSAYDYSGCSDAPSCGDNAADLLAGEVCDGTDLGLFASCALLGYDDGTLDCLSTCADHDLSGCTGRPRSCGNGSLQGFREQCDGTELGGATCESLGFGGGELACNGNCSFDVALCTP